MSQPDDSASADGKETVVQDTKKTSRFVGYFVAMAAGCVMGMVSTQSNARRQALGCTAHCEASIRTLRNFLGVVSSPVLGAFSDVYGRRTTLMASSVVMIMSYVVWCYAANVELFVLYNALNGIAGLSVTFTVCKALVADGSAPEDKVETQGILGAAAGCGIILGPVISMLFLSTYTDAGIGASIVQVCVLAILAFVPFESSRVLHTPQDGTAPIAQAGWLWTMPTAAKRAWKALRDSSQSELILVGSRFTLSLGYHIFLTGFYDTLKERGLLTTPKAWSQYMAFLGVLYALTQRLAAGPLSRLPQQPAMICCVFCIGLGRFLAVTASFTEPVLYASVGLGVLGLAVFNTLINGAATRISLRDGTGGLLGLIQSSEDISGLIGPTLGSVAYEIHPYGPLAACLMLYTALVVTVGFVLWPVVEAAATAVNPPQPDRPKVD